jgi:DNA-binding NarL/FixJ family response regulator
MSLIHNTNAVRIGVVADEPIRQEGLKSIFDECSSEEETLLLPISGRLRELLADVNLDYLLVDLNSSENGLKTLNMIRRARPTLRLIVIGPEGDDDLIMNSILAGARAYLDTSASPRMVRKSIDVVISGYIWAPRRVLSKLIDRLLAVTDLSKANVNPLLTCRETQVLDLILTARSNREIAEELGIEERTVKAHVSNLMRKTGVENRIELSMRALNLSLASQEIPGINQ